MNITTNLIPSGDEGAKLLVTRPLPVPLAEVCLPRWGRVGIDSQVKGFPFGEGDA